MAKKKVSGITIALEADTKGVTSGLKEIITESVNVSKELKDIEQLLKLNPNNVELLSQKQELLSHQIQLTTDKLEALKGAQEDVEKQFQSGKIGEEQYRKFKREIEATEGTLNGYKSQLSKMKVEQDELAQNTKRLATFFEATGTEIDDFSDLLGTRLTAAIKDGKANSSQLEDALNKIGRAALGQTSDINQMKRTLDSLDDGNSIEKISLDLNELKADANKADDALEEIDDTLDKIQSGNLLDAAESFEQIADKAKEASEKVLGSYMEIEDAQKKLTVSMGVEGTKSAEKYKHVLSEVFSSGLYEDIGEAAEGIATVRKNLGDMNEQDLNQLVQNIRVLENLFGVDFNETVRGTTALQKEFGLNGQEALDLITVALQRNGNTWSQEVGDNLAEYAIHFKQNGYSAQQMFETLEAGTKAGAYNLDKVNDVLKEMGIRLSDGSVQSAVEDLGGEWQELYDTMRQSGASNIEIFDTLVQKISKVGSEQEKATLISNIFGSLGEDNGIKVMEALAGVGKEAQEVKGAYDDIAGAAIKANEDSTTASQRLQGVWNEFKEAMSPIGEELFQLLLPILNAIVELLKLFESLPGPVKTFIAAFLGVSVVIGMITGLVLTLQALSLLAGGPVTLALIGVSAAIAGIIVVIKNWGSITEWFSDKWGDLKTWWSDFWGQFGNPVEGALEFIKREAKIATSFLFGSFDDKVNAIKDMFKFLKIKLPKIELPPMPHFDIKWSAKKLFGHKISFPSGIDVKWFADGGILTKPTIFGTNGNQLLGGGEAGKEAIAPLDKLMDYIQKAVDTSLSKQSEEIHLHLTTYGAMPKETMDQIADYLMYKLADVRNEKRLG